MDGDLRDRLARFHVAAQTAGERRTRGREFELWLRDLANERNLDPRSSFRPAGEEIDGSFQLDGRTLLFEAKWLSERIPASAIYAFKAKVDGKLAGTIGLFVSMSGFSEDAVDALRVGKELNIVLLDQNDIEAAIDSGLDVVVRFKLRKAAERGEVFVPFTAAERSRRRRTAGAPAEERAALSDLTRSPLDQHSLAVVVEDTTDEQVVTILLDRFLDAEKLDRQVAVFAAVGVNGLARVTRSLIDELPNATFAVLLDEDAVGVHLQEELRHELSDVSARVILVAPSVESWIGLRHGESRDYEAIYARAHSVDLDRLARSSPAFRELRNLVK